MKKNNNSNRRDFLVNMSMAAAALTLNSAFGFPVETEKGYGRLFLKMENYTFPQDQLERLINGKMESLAIKLEVSLDKKRWQTLNANIEDRIFIKQLGEFALDGQILKRPKRVKPWKRN